ncbi:glycosyltransferase family 61 protein [Pseudomonas entomophila]|uniref:glycosyltransferase family 61 protein n=1 Tax=Pseudomonas entomophila TaxID=312306 RepID=UPI0023D8B8A3|nr:glycosyltransferase family 61 protein [Pseudomonas entomophila]MDF0729868.1 glycosyltransferase family 61 protein [Pseudomonas entomophila]
MNEESGNWQDSARLYLLNKTPLGRFYRRYMKPHAFTRQLAIWAWTRAFPLFVTVFQRMSSHIQAFRLRALRPYAQTLDFLTQDEWVTTPSPKIFPALLASRCPSPHDTYRFPEVYIAQLSDCVVRGGSNLIIHHERVLHHELFRVSHDYTSEEMHGHLVLKPKRRKAYAFRVDPDIERIDEAAIFTDALSSNYAHFMTEVLPRLAMFVKYAAPDMPLLIDAGLHSNIMAAIRCVVGEERTLILLEKGKRVRVGLVHVISNCGYVPFERRPGSQQLSGHSQGQFSPAALNAVREAVWQGLGATDRAGLYLYIRRNSGYRNVVNAQEVEDALVRLGFEVIEPEKLSFAQQVHTFSAAKVVVGATGAAFANLIFCKPDTRIVIMIAGFENTSYYYWQNMACAVGNRVSYVFGDIQYAFGQSIHSDFHVELNHVVDAIAGCLPGSGSAEGVQP